MTQATTNTRLLRLREVIHVTGLSRDSVYKLGREGKFPKPRKLTERTTAWREDEVQAWIAARPISDVPSPNPAAAA